MHVKSLKKKLYFTGDWRVSLIKRSACDSQSPAYQYSLGVDFQ